MKALITVIVFGLASIGCANNQQVRGGVTIEAITATVTATSTLTATAEATVTSTPVATPTSNPQVQLEPEIVDRTGLCHQGGMLSVGDIDDPAVATVFFESENLCLEKIKESGVTFALVSAPNLDLYRQRKKQLECWIEWRNALAVRDDKTPEVNLSYRFFWGPSFRGVPADDLTTHPCDADYRWVK